MATFLLQRKWATDKSTIGELSLDGKVMCFILEDVVRPEKIKGKTAIPAGNYKIIITPSSRFKRDLPLLLNVPNYEGIRIHPGNTAADTEGCLLPGIERSMDKVSASRIAFDHLFSTIRMLLRQGEVWIEIKDVPK